MCVCVCWGGGGGGILCLIHKLWPKYHTQPITIWVQSLPNEIFQGFVKKDFVIIFMLLLLLLLLLFLLLLLSLLLCYYLIFKLQLLIENSAELGLSSPVTFEEYLLY